MSRLEKTLKKKSKNKKLKMLGKVMFIFFFIVNTIICICVVDFNAKKMLGQETYINANLNKIEIYLGTLISSIEDKSLNIKEQLNNSIK